jgi:hypothetical protein
VILKWFYSGATVVLQCCHIGVTLVLQWCYSGVTVVLQWCSSGVTVVLQCCYSGVTSCITPAPVCDKLRFHSDGACDWREEMQDVCSLSVFVCECLCVCVCAFCVRAFMCVYTYMCVRVCASLSRISVTCEPEGRIAGYSCAMCACVCDDDL